MPHVLPSLFPLVTVFSVLASPSANAMSLCNGAHRLVIKWDKGLINIDGRTFHMQTSQNKRGPATATGPGFTLVHYRSKATRGSYSPTWSLTYNGQTSNYTCSYHGAQ
jgi:hypothetical protein